MLFRSSFYYSYIAMQIPAGIFYDRFGIKWVALTAMFVIALGCFLLACAPKLIFAICARVIIGLGCSFGFVGMLFGIKLWFPGQQFPLISAIAESASMVGVALANSLLSHIFLSFGWRVSMYGCSGFAFITACLIGLAIDEQFKNKKESHENLHPRFPGKSEIIALFKKKELLIGGGFSACVFSVISVFATLWAIPFLMTGYQMNVVQATSICSTIYLGIAVSSPVLGWLVGVFSITAIMSIGAGLSLFFMIILLYFSGLSVSLLYFLAFCLGFCCAVYQLSFTLVSQSSPDHLQGVALGTTNMIAMLAAPILQPIIGFLISWSRGGGVLDGFEVYGQQAYQQALLILPICLALAFIGSFLLDDSRVGRLRKHFLHVLFLRLRQSKSWVKH